MLARMTSSRKTKRQPLRRTQRLGDRDEPRQDVGHLHAGELGAPAVADDHREVLAQVRDQRERVTRVERERREHRADLAREVGVEVLADRVGPRILVEQRDVFGRQQRTELLPAGRHRLAASAAPARASPRAAAACCSRPARRPRSPRGRFFCVVEIRIMKNSSRFVAAIARNFTRSSSGCEASSAWSSTRWLNSSQLSSRLM